MPLESRRPLNRAQLLTGAAFFLLFVLAERLVVYPGSRAVLLLGGGLAAFLIIARPVIGLALYLLVYPAVSPAQSLNPLKIFIFALTLIVLLTWLVRKMMMRERFISKREYMWMYFLFIFLCISPALGYVNGFTPVDWARDIAPLLNLLLVPVMADYFGWKKNGWLLFLVFAPAGLSIARDLLVLSSRYGFPVTGVPVLTSLPLGSIHPSLSLGLGTIMYLQRAPYRRFWLGLAIAGLAAALLTPTRTVWITTATMALLLVLFNSRRRIWTIASLAAMAALAGWLVFYGPGSGDYLASQRVRVSALEHWRHDPSAESRLDEMKQTARLFESSPLIGVGFGYQYFFWRHFWAALQGPGYMKTNFTHNDIMFIASKGGMTGLALFLMMLLGFAKKLHERRKEEPGSLRSAWATFALMALINSIIIGSSTPFYQDRFEMYIFAVIMAMGLGFREGDRGRKVA